MTESWVRFTGLRLVGFAFAIGLLCGLSRPPGVFIPDSGRFDWRTATGYPVPGRPVLWCRFRMCVFAALGSLVLPRLPWDTSTHAPPGLSRSFTLSCSVARR